jgi:hypothetical protein
MMRNKQIMTILKIMFFMIVPGALILAPILIKIENEKNKKS